MDLTAAFHLATVLLEQHGLAGWKVEYDNAKKRAGICRPGFQLIGLSAPLTRLHSEEQVRDTILHEIAHALVGPGHGHDEVWRAKAIEIGSSGTRCMDEDAPRLKGAWLGVCRAGHTHEMHKRPEKPVSCAKCGTGGFSLDHLFEWTFRGRPAQMHPNYEMYLEQARRGLKPTLLTPGSKVRVTVPGTLHRAEGTILKRGRTRYHVQLPQGVYGILFAGVEPVE